MTRSITARACRSPDEVTAAAACVSHYFGTRPGAEWLERWSAFFDMTRMHAAFDGNAIVGGAGAFTLSLSVPGGAVPAAGISVVGVMPTHRRRGALTSMMRAQLDDVRARGEAVACLWASEGTIYPRFGYGVATMAMEMDIPRTHTRFREPFVAAGTARLLTTEEALEILPPLYERVRARTPGLLSRSAGWWRNRRLLDTPDRRQGGGPLEHVLLEIEGKPEGYALYRVKSALEHEVAVGHVDVLEAFGTSAAATSSLWRILLDFDWTAAIRARILPVDHPLRLLLAEPRRAGFRVYESLWLRLVDVGAALSARTSASDAAPIVVEVRDRFCSWNEGRWSIANGKVERAEQSADVALDVADLASVYLGGFRFLELAEAGRVEERERGAVGRADALFLTERAPFNAEVF